MFVSEVNAASQGAGSPSSAQRAMAEKEQFLALLVAQISHQDPMNPVDDKDMVSQLAQFSAIEQHIETNKQLSELKDSTDISGRVSIASLVGKEATAIVKDVTVGEGGAPAPIAVNLPGSAEEVTIRVLDSDNNLLRTIDAGPMGVGMHSVAWDGRGTNHQAIGPGRYRVQVSARDAAGQELVAKNEMRGVVTRVDIDGKEPAIYINNARVALRDLAEIGH